MVKKIKVWVELSGGDIVTVPEWVKTEEDLEKYEKQKEVLFIKADLKKLQAAKRDYSKIVDFYKAKLVELGAMREIKNKCKTSEKIYSRIKRQEKKEIG